MTVDRVRQEENKEEIACIQQGTIKDKENKEYKVKTEDKQGTLLDESGKTHAVNPAEVLEDTNNESVNPESQIPTRSTRQASVIESTLSDFKNIFNTNDTDDRYKLNNEIPIQPIAPHTLIKQLQTKAIKYIITACFICYFVGRFRYGFVSGILVISACAWSYWNLGKTSSEGVEWQLEKDENIKTLYTSEGETVEWLNFILEKIWRSIDPEIFNVVEDLLEDTIQSVSPSIIKRVKVCDFDIGVQAPRVQMIRIFPPLPGQHQESIFGEASFSFHSHPIASLATNRSTRSSPPGLSLRFQTVLSAPLEVKSELTAFSGKIRFKLLTSPEVPFISKATIAFTSVPKIETGVMPLSKHFNIMNLPTIKTLVNKGIKLGFSDIVDPKSLTVDVRALMGAFTQDTNSIGVVKVQVRQAKRNGSLHLQDLKDSYTTISLSTQPKKSVSSTRVLTNDKDPRWNENLYILIHSDDILSETKIDLKVWDADKIKYDDMWGSVSMSVRDIVQGQLDNLGNVSDWCHSERVVYDGWTPIDGKSLERSKVKLDMKMSFHPKYATPNSESLAKLMPQDNNIRKESDEEPFDPEHTNGILSITIHQATDLEIGDPSVLHLEDHSRHPYSPGAVVNPYAILYINDNKVYRTRTKIRNPSPHWNADSEHFVRNMNDCFIRVSVKTALELERDPVLGTKVISLKDLFINQHDKFKEFQKWLPLTDGIGYGKVLLTIKYKPVKMSLPRELQGSDVGTLVIDQLVLNQLKTPLDPSFSNTTKATLSLNVDPVITKRLKSRDIQTDRSEIGWYDRRLYFPLTMRYRTALYIHISQGSLTGPSVTGRIWLKDVIEGEWQECKVGLHHHLSEKHKEANRNEDPWDEQGGYGQVTVRFKIVPGFSPVHTHLRSFKKDMVGADPFFKDTLKIKSRQWMKDQDSEMCDYGFRLDEENESSQSSEYGQESDSEISNTQADMIDQRRVSKINKHGVLRKLSWSVDKMRHKVDILREGFNSESRAKRAVTKE